MSWRAVFLLGFAATVLHLGALQCVFLFVGYGLVSLIDSEVSKRRTKMAIEDDLWGWEPDPEDPESENKTEGWVPRLSVLSGFPLTFRWGKVGELEGSRVNLPNQQKVVLVRIAELLMKASGEMDRIYWLRPF